MSYATVTDMLDRFAEIDLAELTDPGHSVVDVARVETKLAEACNLINAAVGVRYALPLATVPSILVDVECDIAFYRLHKREAPDAVRRRFEDARATLDRISTGKMMLEAAGVAPPAPSEVGIAASSSPRLFSRDSMRGL